MFQEMKNKAIEACRGLHDTLRANAGDVEGVVDIFIYFDEAHVLTERHPLDSPRSQTIYNVLRSVFNDFLDDPVFVVFISTRPHLGACAPPCVLENSARALASGPLQAPITETPFDCAPNILVQTDTYTWEQVADVRFMARFGRPL